MAACEWSDKALTCLLFIFQPPKSNSGKRSSEFETFICFHSHQLLFGELFAQKKKKNPWNMIRWRSFAYRLFHPRSQFTRITNYENMLRVSVFPQHCENDIPMHDAHFTVSFWTFSSLTFVNDLGLRHWIHVVETRTIEQFKRENILQFIPRDCFVRLGLSMLSRRLDVSCTIRFFGSVTKLVSLSLFHTISTMESMLDDRGSFSWFLWEENFNESEGEKKMRMNGKP